MSGHKSLHTASCILLGALAATVFAAPVAQARSTASSCLVRNVTQGTSSRNFRVVVTLAHDGDELRVRGRCTTRGIAIDHDLVIRGMGKGATLDGQHRYRVLRIAKGAVVTLRHLVLTHGVPAKFPYVIFFSFGGGISNRGTLTLIDSLVTENEAYGGGGISNFGTLTLIRSRISDHGTGFPDGEGDHLQGVGGGIYNVGRAILEDSTVSANDSQMGGGGIYNIGTITLRRSRVSGNKGDSGDGGGGISNYSGTLTLIDSRVTGNASWGGGGISNAGTLRLIHSVVRGNMADSGGGILNSRHGTVTLSAGSSVTDNVANGGPGGVIAGGGVYNRGTFTVRDSVVRMNRAGLPEDEWNKDSRRVGGGIYNARGAVLHLRHVTVSGNAAAQDGGGIYNRGAITRTDVYVTDNTPNDCVGC